MQLKPIYIPFGGIFPALTGFLSAREDFMHHFPRIDQKTLYGQAHTGTSVIDRRISNLHLIMHRIRIDQITFLTPLIYERQGILHRNSFSDQLKWFKEDKTGFDIKCRNSLLSNMQWFTEIRDIRDDALHRRFWSYAEMKTKGEVKK